MCFDREKLYSVEELQRSAHRSAMLDTYMKSNDDVPRSPHSRRHTISDPTSTDRRMSSPTRALSQSSCTDESECDADVDEDTVMKGRRNWATSPKKLHKRRQTQVRVWDEDTVMSPNIGSWGRDLDIDIDLEDDVDPASSEHDDMDEDDGRQSPHFAYQSTWRKRRRALDDDGEAAAEEKTPDMMEVDGSEEQVAKARPKKKGRMQ